MWTPFLGMHSGGSLKEKQHYIYIEAPEAEARVIFYNRFGHNPDRVTCTCCGDDYSISEEETLREVTAFERGCDYENHLGYLERAGRFGAYQTLETYLHSGGAHFIPAEEIQ